MRNEEEENDISVSMYRKGMVEMLRRQIEVCSKVEKMPSRTLQKERVYSLTYKTFPNVLEVVVCENVLRASAGQ